VTDDPSLYACMSYSVGDPSSDTSAPNAAGCWADKVILLITVGVVCTWTYLLVSLYILNRPTSWNRVPVTPAMDEELEVAEGIVL